MSLFLFVMNTGKVLIGGSVLVIGLIIGITVFFMLQPGSYDEFAKCVADSGVVVYESFDCPPCMLQKGFFGNSHKVLNSVECGPVGAWTNEDCSEKEIPGTPTWLDKDDNRLDVGPVVDESSLARLSELTGCPLS